MNNENEIEKICAPVDDIHFCPICSKPFLENPEKSIVIANTEICPTCADREKSFYPNYINYFSMIRRRGVAKTFPGF